MVKKNDAEAQVLGIPFFSRTKADLLIELEEKELNSRSTTYIFTPNPEQLVQAESDPAFKTSLQQADIRIPDGMGIVWASHILSWRGKSLPLIARIGGTDLAADLLKLAAKNQWRVLLVGGRGYGKIEGVKWLKGYEDVTQPTQQEEQLVAETIQTWQPHLVLVALGAPAQENWALQHRRLLENSGVKIVMVVGGAFDYLLKKVPRAPRWVQQLGFEWLFRLTQEPWRWKRQLRLGKFIWLVIKETLT